MIDIATIHEVPISSMNYILRECDIPWRIGIVIKAWKEELDKGLGGIGFILLVHKDPVTVKGENQKTWIIHPSCHEKYAELCGNPPGRYPMILDEAIDIPLKLGD